MPPPPASADLAPPPAVKRALLSAIPGLAHGFFGRRGGASSGIYESLNCGLGSRDDPAAVRDNRHRAARALGLDPARLTGPHQVHSARALVIDAPLPEPRPEADAVVTAAPGLALSVLTADCAPILLADPDARVIGAVHAGWRGALDGVLEAAIAAMRARGATAAGIRAVIGPTIGPASYEVGPEFVARFCTADPANARYFIPADGDRSRFDLPAYIRARAAACGLAQVEELGRDTYAEDGAWFSHRRSVHARESDYGRNISIIGWIGEGS